MTGPRVGLVLGAGGVAGGAFHAGALAAIEEATGWDPRTADVIVGTSAGSIAATSLRAGLSAADMLARATNRPLSSEGRALLGAIGPPRQPSRLRTEAVPRSSRQIAATLATAARQPFAARPWALLAGLLPGGTMGTEVISDSVAALFPGSWPQRSLWICAVRQRDGRRRVFGRDAAAPLADAVAASCAIPGYFAPVQIDGDDYIDGGVHSPTNADVLVGGRLDLVVISSPMSLSGRSLRIAVDQPARRWSRALLDAEARKLRRRGVAVVAFQPTHDDAAIVGPNAMDEGRRASIARNSYESTLRRLARADTRKRLAALSGGRP